MNPNNGGFPRGEMVCIEVVTNMGKSLLSAEQISPDVFFGPEGQIKVVRDGREWAVSNNGN